MPNVGLCRIAAVVIGASALGWGWLGMIQHPGMDGLQLLGEIKQRRADLPVMMVTAYGDDERRGRAGELGAFEFITKPVDFAHLKVQLRRLASAAA